MVDVGYFIDGRHGVIRNVKATHNDRGLDAIWFENEEEELYRLKFKDIEYIIPHEQECKAEEICKPYTEEEMIKLCQSVDKPMTYKEKFVEVFGYEPDTDKLEGVCDMFDCTEARCAECKYGHMKWHWGDEYREK